MINRALICHKSTAIRRLACKMTGEHTQFKHANLNSFLDKYLNHKPEEEHHKKILIVRHGQSYGNLRQLWYGITNYELTPKGIEQAKNMRNALAPLVKQVDNVFASELKRAQQTAKIIFDLDYPLEDLKDGYKSTRHHQTFTIDKRFNEYDLGGLENIDVSQLTFAEHEFINRLHLEGKFVRDDIEQPSQVLQRATAGLRDLDGSKNNVLVAHYGLLHVLLNNMGYFGMHIDTGDCLHIDVDQDGYPHELKGYWAK